MIWNIIFLFVALAGLGALVYGVYKIYRVNLASFRVLYKLQDKKFDDSMEVVTNLAAIVELMNKPRADWFNIFYYKNTKDGIEKRAVDKRVAGG